MELPNSTVKLSWDVANSLQKKGLKDEEASTKLLNKANKQSNFKNLENPRKDCSDIKGIRVTKSWTTRIITRKNSEQSIVNGLTNNFYLFLLNTTDGIEDSKNETE